MKISSFIILQILLLLAANSHVNFVCGYGIFSAFKSTIAAGYGSLRCRFTTCCDDWGIIKNFSGLEEDLMFKLHGQHLVRRTVVGHIKSHMLAVNPPKALVLSFHGPSGVGKNFVSRIIAENIYKNGLNSPFVHMIAATREFPHEGKVPFYKDQLKSWIEGNVTKCEQSLFIFDEVDKLPAKLLDVIKPYMDYYEHLGGVNYRRAIFIFLSNTGGTDIARYLLDRWRTGESRETLELSEVESMVMSSAVNDENKSGLWHSQLIISHLVTAFIPFLPLEKEHVRKCIIDYLRSEYSLIITNTQDDIVDEILRELTFSPPLEQVFSSTGCKRVAEKTDYVMVDGDIHPKSKILRSKNLEL